jgi:hypothetical protein
MEPPSVQSPFAHSRCYRDLGRHELPPRRTLLLRLSSYGLMRRSRRLSSPSAIASFEESLQVATSPCCHRSGRTMARIGLRMMPPFPSSPLSSVQRVFPSTAGRPVYQTVLYPSSASSSRRMVCHRPSCTTLPVAPYPRSKSRGAVPWYTTVQAAIAALPQGSSLRSGLCCPGPSSLSRPHAPHSPAHLDFTDPAYTRCLRCASKLQRLGNQ